jgi:GMP synthase (glutamine-hydrolysing)
MGLKTLIVSNNSKKIGSLEEIVLPFSNEVKIVHYDKIPPFEECEKFDIVILSGGSNLAIPKHRELFKKEIELIKNITKPILGVCLGFELIADTFGAKLKYRTEKVHGLFEVEKIQEDPVFDDKKFFKVYEAHKYYVDSLENTKLIPLAKSKWGIEIFKHETRLIYGFQFHPEDLLENNDGVKLFKNWIENIYGSN